MREAITMEMQRTEKIQDAMAANDAVEELQRARAKFDPFNSAHEGYAVLLEEVEELWIEVRTKSGTKQSQRAEAIQIAAMALRFAADVCPVDPLERSKNR